MWQVITACVLSLCSTDPLDRLEHSARSYTVWESAYNMPTGATRLQDLQQLGRLVTNVLGVAIVSEIPPEVEAQVPGVAGVMMRQERVIALDKALSPDAQLQVLAHEAGHVLQPPGLSASEGQVFADAVSFLVTGDDVDIFGRYLAAHKNGLGVLKTYRREIYWAAKVLGGK